MGNDVFANGRELSCKAGSGKSICAFPDVCFTPPQTPATPPGVPIPYPNTGMSSDPSKGSRDVKITRKEVMLKNKSMFKKSVGDQAGCAPKKGVVTSQTGGKVYFNSWSMDVKIEGENAVRHLDLTTHNHGSVPGNTPTWPFIDTMDAGFVNLDDPCVDDMKKEYDACKDFQPHNKDGADACDGFKAKPKGAMNAMDKAKERKANDCLTARSCQLVPYKPKGDQPGCCHGQTGHHLIEAAAFHQTGRGTNSKSKSKSLKVVRDAKGEYTYSMKEAPCVCVFGTNQFHGTHGVMHTFQGAANAGKAKERTLAFQGDNVAMNSVTYSEARDSAVYAMGETFPDAGCKKECLDSQLDAYHKDELGLDDGDFVKAVDTGYTGPQDVVNAKELVRVGFDRANAVLGGTTGHAKVAP